MEASSTQSAPVSDGMEPSPVARVLTERERQRESNWYDLQSEAGGRYSGCRLSSFVIHQKQDVAERQRKIVSELHEYCKTISERQEKCEGIVLYGPVGTGKDHLAFAVARAIVGSFGRVRWIRGQDWFGGLRDAMDTKTPETNLLYELTMPPWLVLSDPLPPAGSLTTYQTSMLFRAIDERYSSGRPTIVTINVADDAEADSRLGTAVWDRLCHGAWKLQCKWGSHRKPAKEVKW